MIGEFTSANTRRDLKDKENLGKYDNNGDKVDKYRNRNETEDEKLMPILSNIYQCVETHFDPKFRT